MSLRKIKLSHVPRVHDDCGELFGPVEQIAELGHGHAERKFRRNETLWDDDLPNIPFDKRLIMNILLNRQNTVG